MQMKKVVPRMKEEIMLVVRERNGYLLAQKARLSFFHPVPGKFIAQLKVSFLHHLSRS